MICSVFAFFTDVGLSLSKSLFCRFLGTFTLVYSKFSYKVFVSDFEPVDACNFSISCVSFLFLLYKKKIDFYLKKTCLHKESI